MCSSIFIQADLTLWLQKYKYHLRNNLVYMNQPFSILIHPVHKIQQLSPCWPNCFKLQLTLESTQKLTRFVQLPPLPWPDSLFQCTLPTWCCAVLGTTQCSGPSWRPPCWGTTTSRSSTWSRSAEDPCSSRINLGAGTVLCPACCGRLISRCPQKFQTRPLSTSCRKGVPERESLL